MSQDAIKGHAVAISTQTGVDDIKGEVTGKYRGLGNQGATCYMNSLLQTLFMTPEFRLIMYGWEYDENIHGKRMYSIPYQLQKLFAKLQIGSWSYVETLALSKSFNWDIGQSMEQQDILEFSTVLFGAIESSDPDRKININQLYEGIVSDYIKCKICGGGSNKKDIFLNLSLPINSSLEKALENYLKPQVMSGSNAYECGNCNTKVEANRGTSFSTLPLILTIQLNRFFMDYKMSHRVKINDRLIFPFILNMNNYMNGYDGIKQVATECEQRLEEELKIYHIEVPTKKQSISNKIKPTIEEKEEIKVDQFSKDSSKEDKGSKDNTKERPKEEERKQAKEESKEAKPKEEKKVAENNNVEGKTYSIGPEGIIDEFDTPYTTAPLGKEENIGGISGVDLTEEERGNSYLWEVKPKTCKTISGDQPICSAGIFAHYKDTYIGDKFDSADAYPVMKSEKEELEEAMQKFSQMENQEKVDKLHKQQIEEYLKQGEDVYELFAVNVHSGGAFGGHYYGYIKSFEDNKWYCFNDTTVTIASEWDVVGTFGSKEAAKCAYMLTYRKVGIPPPIITNETLPEYLRNEIEIERVQEEEYEKKRRTELKKLNVTIYYMNKCTIIEAQKDDTLKKLKEKIIDMFKIEATVENTRLRAYAKNRNIMLDIYPPEKDNMPLDKLGISMYRSYAIEIKAPKENFAQYTEDDMYIRLVVYNPSLTILDEESLPVKNLQIKRSSSIKQLIEKIAEELKVPAAEEKLRAYRRHRGNTYQDNYFESLFYDEIMETPIKDLFIYDGSYIYVETINNEEELKKSRWVKALEEDKAKVHVLFNDPHSSATSDYSVGYENEIITNKNIKLKDLRKLIAEKLLVKEDEFIMKCTGKDGPEFKELNQTLASLHFTRNSTVFIELGKPSKIDEYRLLLSEAIISNNENDDTEFYEFIELGDFNIIGNYTVFQVKDIISSNLLSERKIEVPPTRIRLRDRIGDKLGKVFIDSVELGYYGMHDSKPISFQILTEDENFGPNDLAAVVREWNPEDWSLSERMEITVKTTWRMHDLSYYLCDYYPQYRNQIENISIAKLPTLWNFKRGEFLGLFVSCCLIVVVQTL